MDLIVFLPKHSFSSNTTKSTVPKTCRHSAPAATVTLRSNSLTDWFYTEGQEMGDLDSPKDSLLT